MIRFYDIKIENGRGGCLLCVLPTQHYSQRIQRQDFNIDGYAIGVCNELRQALEGLVEEKKGNHDQGVSAFQRFRGQQGIISFS